MEREITCLSSLLAKMGQTWDLSPDLPPSLPSLHSPRMETERDILMEKGKGLNMKAS